MHAHPYFNLRLHDDGELNELIGETVVARATLHEWPLSCVQKLVLADGRRLVYKSAWGPTVEAEFYARVNSPLLVSARSVYAQDGYICLLIDWIDAPRLEESQMAEADLLRAAFDVLNEIQRLPEDLPCFLDLRLDGWSRVVDQIVPALYSLCQSRQFQYTTLREIERIEWWCGEKSILDALSVNLGLVHGDLTVDNLFIQAGGFRVIDWQRPIYGPRLLDLVDLLESGGIKPGNYVETGLLRLRRLLSIHWLVQCAQHWFPQGKQTYDRQIAELVDKLEAGT